MLSEIWADPDYKEVVLTLVKWTKEGVVEAKAQLLAPSGAVVSEHGDPCDVPLRAVDPRTGEEYVVLLEQVDVVYRLGSRWRGAGELPEEVQVLTTLLRWCERGVIRTAAQVRAPSGVIAAEFSCISELPERVVDPRSGEEFDVLIDNVEVVYRLALKPSLHWPYVSHAHPSTNATTMEVEPHDAR